MYLNINDLIDNDTNLIEIFLCSNIKKDANVIDVSISEELVNKISNKFKKTREITYSIFNRCNLSYIYDMSNDSQIVTTKLAYKNKYLYNNRSKIFNNYYIISYKENKLPTQYFPCTNDIDYKTTYNIKEFRIDNRIIIIIREEEGIYTSYIQYRHSINVDLDKIQDTLNNLIKTIGNIY
jgi:hypothetical protein